MIKCVCGERDCTTVIEVEYGANSICVAIKYKTPAKSDRIDIELDPNGVVELIKNLKNALLEITK